MSTMIVVRLRNVAITALSAICLRPAHAEPVSLPQFIYRRPIGSIDFVLLLCQLMLQYSHRMLPIVDASLLLDVGSVI